MKAFFTSYEWAKILILTKRLGNRLILMVFALFLFSFVYTAITFGQGPVIVFSENFDNAGSTQPWAPNFSSGWFCAEPLNVLQAESGKGKVLKANFPAGTVGVQAGFGNYRIPLDSAYKELYFTWDYFLSPNFDFGWGDGLGGGKFFGGFTGGSMTAIPNNDATDEDGWASIFMFQDGYSTTYNYFKGSTFSSDGWPYGEVVANIAKGQWRNMTIRLKINDGDQRNGIFEVYENGVLVYQQTNAKIVNSLHPEYLIEHLYLNAFFGGSGAKYVSPVNQYMEFDNLVAFYYSPGSAGYRAGASEKGRVIQIPTATSYHPLPPNRFKPTGYTDANGTIRSHCAFYQHVNHTDNFETSTIQVSGATSLNINVSKFHYDAGANYIGYKQILKIYQGIGSAKVLKQTFQYGINTAPGSISIGGNSATIEWQAGQGLSDGFVINYTSNGTGSGKNFSCGDYFAKQKGIQGTPVTPPPVTPPSDTIPVAPPSDTIPVTPPPVTPPNVVPPVTTGPLTLTVQSVSSNSSTLIWNDNSTNESFFEVERSGPINDVRKTVRVNANLITYTDGSLEANSKYIFWIRSYSTASGYSAYSSPVYVNTPVSAPKIVTINAPSKLKNTKITEKSITIAWNDNSNNENGFLITREYANEPDSSVTMIADANDTMFVDESLSPNTTYIYTVKAISNAGKSESSNKNIASTLSIAETRRVKDGLIAYYNFAYNPDYIIPDLSGYGEPLDLMVLNPAAVAWNNQNKMEVLSGTALVSTTPANKVVSAVKKTGEITVECWIKPTEPSLLSSSRVISLGIDDSQTGFVMDQDFSSVNNEKSLNYKIRMQTESTSESGYPEISPVNNINFLNMQHIVYVRDTSGLEKLYINGEKVAEGFRPSNFNTWNNGFYLRLGNEKDLNHPWSGIFYSTAIYNKALSASEVNKNYATGPCDNILNNGQDFSIKVYPNPITDIANVEVEPISSQDYIPETYIRVLDIYGKLCHEETIFNPGNQFQTSLDFKNYTRGIYFLQVVSGSHQKSTKLIVL